MQPNILSNNTDPRRNSTKINPFDQIQNDLMLTNINTPINNRSSITLSSPFKDAMSLQNSTPLKYNNPFDLLEKDIESKRSNSTISNNPDTKNALINKQISLSLSSHSRAGSTASFNLLSPSHLTQGQLLEQAKKLESDIQKFITDLSLTEEYESFDKLKLISRFDSLKLLFDKANLNHQVLITEYEKQKLQLEIDIKKSEELNFINDQNLAKEIQNLKDTIKSMEEKFGVLSAKREISLVARSHSERVETVGKIYTFLRGLDRDTYQMIVAQINGMAPSEII